MCQPGSRLDVAALAIAVATAWLGLAPGRAAAAGTQVVGAWDLKLQGGEHQCRVTLRPEVASSGYALAMPVGCRRAFPILQEVASWIDTGDGKLQLDDNAGQPVLAFEPGPDGVLTGTSPQGEIYRLEAAGPHKDLPRRIAAAPAPVAAKPADPAASDAQPAMAVVPLRAPKPADLAGYFSVLREKTRDTGCMVTFDDKTRGPKGSFKAHLAPACRDQGIIIFDPVGWQLAGDRLVLTARKGHTAKFDLQPDGSWLKDPTDGKSMSLKKM